MNLVENAVGEWASFLHSESIESTLDARFFERHSKKLTAKINSRKPEGRMAGPCNWQNAQHRIFLGGPPGSGKGTIAARLAEELGILAISTGDLCRAEIRQKTAVGLAIQERVEAGVVRVDASYWLPALIPRLEAAPANGWLLDGAPRWKEQVADLSAAGLSPTIFLVLDLSDEECLERLGNRVIDPTTGDIYNRISKPPPIELDCSVRIDDQADKARKRVTESAALMAGVDTWYPEGVVIHINASAPIEEVYRLVKEKLI